MKLKNYLRLVVFIILAGLLSACDPLAHPFFTADQIVITGKTAYLHVSERPSWGIGAYVQNADHYFASEDYEVTWQEITSPPVDISPAIEDPQVVQLTACVPNDPGICYRIGGREQVEISNDGGSTWQIDWEMPPGRSRYMAKNPAITPFFRITPDTVPYDLGIIAAGDGHSVIAAMGNQGVLVKSTAGEWERYGISSAESAKLGMPLPYYAASFKDARLALGTEATWTFFAAFIFWVSLSFLGWRNVYTNVDKPARTKILWSGAPFVLTMTGFFLFLISLVFLFFSDLLAPGLPDSPLGSFLLELASISPLYLCTIPIMGMVISWSLVAAFSPNRRSGLLGALVSLGYALVFFVGILLPLTLWAFGIIPFYEIALIIAGILGLLSVYFGYRQVKQMAILAAWEEA